MRKCIIPIVAVLATVAFASESLEIDIVITPKVLNLDSEGVVATVHTDIAFGAVSTSSVYLNDVLIQSWKADNRGNFVAKFNLDEVKGIDGVVPGETATLTLSGETVDGVPFTGSADVRVIGVGNDD